MLVHDGAVQHGSKAMHHVGALVMRAREREKWSGLDNLSIGDSSHPIIDSKGIKRAIERFSQAGIS
jgi:hypothetical protein